MLNILTTPLGYIMSFCYRLSGSYAALHRPLRSYHQGSPDASIPLGT